MTLNTLHTLLTVTVLLTCLTITRQSPKGIQNPDFMDCVLQTREKGIVPSRNEPWQVNRFSQGYKLVELREFNPLWSQIFPSSLQGVKLTFGAQIKQKDIMLETEKVHLRIKASCSGNQKMHMQVKIIWNEGKDKKYQGTYFIYPSKTPKMFQLTKLVNYPSGNTIRIFMHTASKVVLTQFQLVHEGSVIYTRKEHTIPPFSQTIGIQYPIFNQYKIQDHSLSRELKGHENFIWRSNSNILLVKLAEYNNNWRLKSQIQGILIDNIYNSVHQEKIRLPEHRRYYLSFDFSIANIYKDMRTIAPLLLIKWNNKFVGRCHPTENVMRCKMYVHGEKENNKFQIDWHPQVSNEGFTICHQIIMSGIFVMGDNGRQIYHQMSSIEHLERKKQADWQKEYELEAAREKAQSGMRGAVEGAGAGITPRVEKSSILHHAEGIQDPFFADISIPKEMNQKTVPVNSQMFWRSQTDLQLVKLQYFNPKWKGKQSIASQGVILDMQHKNFHQKQIYFPEKRTLQLHFKASHREEQQYSEQATAKRISYILAIWNDAADVIVCEVEDDVIECHGSILVQAGHHNHLQFLLNQRSMAEVVVTHVMIMDQQGQIFYRETKKGPPTPKKSSKPISTETSTTTLLH